MDMLVSSLVLSIDFIRLLAISSNFIRILHYFAFLGETTTAKRMKIGPPVITGNWRPSKLID